MIRNLVLACALGGLALSASAHTALQTSTPVSGSILSASPEKVTLTFKEPTRLISVQLVSAKVEKRLTFTPSGQATTFTVSAPGLQLGRNEVRWRAISLDGHPVEGTVLLVVKAQKP